MRVLFSGDLGVRYGQFSVESDLKSSSSRMERGFAGQANGLCGAALPGMLFLVTGLHTGDVPLTVELHDDEPPVGDAWEDVVEVSFTPVPADEVALKVALNEWGGAGWYPLGLAVICYRVRYCASGMDEGHQVNVRTADEPEADRYLLQFWPAPPAPDRVVKQTSRSAAYSHDVARKLPPPISPEAGAEAAGRAELEAKCAREASRRRNEAGLWGGREPSDRLRNVGGNAIGLARLDRDLVDAVEAADPGRQRAIARWAARRAYTEAGLERIDWLAGGLAAAEEGRELPRPFADTTLLFQFLFLDDRVPRTTVASADGQIPNMSQQAMAAAAPKAAAEPDPLRAALDALHIAAHTAGGGWRACLDEVRRVFLTANEHSTGQ